MKATTHIKSVEDSLEKPGMLYFYQSLSSFVIQDLVSFNESFAVAAFLFQPKIKAFLPLTIIKEKIFLLKNIISSDIMVCQFAGYHSLLPVIFGKIFMKPCIIIVGGTDCTSMPSINYGNLRKMLMRWFTLKSLKYAFHIISPGISLIECDYTYSDSDYRKQGYKSFDSSIKTPYSIIHNGIDTTRFRIYPEIRRKENSFLTICTTIDKRTYRLKGIDLFFKIADSFPEFEFTVIGRKIEEFEILPPSNVTLIDFVPHELLPSKIAGYTFYCQLSMSEGFGISLAEAMACGCVPLVSKVGIMDYIIGDSGFILEKYDIDLLLSLVTRAVDSDTKSLGEKARIRIVENFDMQKRKTSLKALLGDIIQK
jgi:glycosyltransferase involved in cell wall biosynthesis